MALSGAEWIDFTIANKGTAIRVLQERFGFARDEIMAFGDNFNDREMLEEVGHPYVMENAAPDVRALCPNHCRRVEDVLEALLRSLAGCAANSGAVALQYSSQSGRCFKIAACAAAAFSSAKKANTHRVVRLF